MHFVFKKVVLINIHRVTIWIFDGVYVASCKPASSPLFFNECYHLKIEEPMKLLPAVYVEKHEHKFRPSKINGMAQSISTACNDIQEYSCPMKKN